MTANALLNKSTFLSISFEGPYWLALTCLISALLLTACGGGSSSSIGSGNPTPPSGGSGVSPGGDNSNGAGTIVVGNNGPVIGTLPSVASQLKLVAGNTSTAGNLDGATSVAKFNGASTMVVDSFGNIVVWDAGNSVLRKITPGGQVSTLAGHYVVDANTADWCSDGLGAAANLQSIGAMTAGNNGDIYVVDNGCAVVRKITSAGLVTKFASPLTDGSGGYTKGSYTSRYIAFDRSSSNLYILLGSFQDWTGAGFQMDPSFIYGGMIRQITPSGTVTTIASSSGTSALYTGIVTDGAGNLYISDFNRSAILKLDKTGLVSTLAIDAPGSLLTDANGNLVSVDVFQGIKTFSIAGKLIRTMQAPFLPDIGNGQPNSIANLPLTFDTSNNLLVGANTSVKMVTSDGIVSTLAGVDPDYGYSDGVGALAQFHSPTGLAADGAGNVYVADRLNYIVRKITPNGVVSTFAGTAGKSGLIDGAGAAALFVAPMGLAIDPAGNIYVLDLLGSQMAIRKITSTGIVSTIYSGGNALTLTAIAVDANGNIYVANHDYNARMDQIQRVSGAGQLTSYLTLGDTVSSFAIDGKGDVFVVTNNALRKLTPQGVKTIIAGKVGDASVKDGVGISAGLGAASKIAIDAGGNFFLSDFANHLVRRVTPQGVVTTYLGKYGNSGINLGIAPGSLFAPNALAISGTTLYIASGNAILAGQ
ncbi:hypothetical protein [Undibacterium terreum]|uniref:NHL repeat-containing protein n=1 Tax=Undibacterium terreum TaxID=1224302 RepID=A0A916UU32_9BURK|nr:hypothetical protein [Undibacterium terreum]GGC87056.1 hypothetical protein GCM10011396_37950 [Undibacterium terreum]